jgi:hypothetical protein
VFLRSMWRGAPCARDGLTARGQVEHGAKLAAKNKDGDTALHGPGPPRAVNALRVFHSQSSLYGARRALN